MDVVAERSGEDSPEVVFSGVAAILASFCDKPWLLTNMCFSEIPPMSQGIKEVESTCPIQILIQQYPLLTKKFEFELLRLLEKQVLRFSIPFIFIINSNGNHLKKLYYSQFHATIVLSSSLKISSPYSQSLMQHFFHCHSSWVTPTIWNQCEDKYANSQLLPLLPTSRANSCSHPPCVQDSKGVL